MLSSRGVKQKFAASTQPEGVFVRRLRKARSLTWVRVCAVVLDCDGKDRLGRYHGRTGVPLYAIEYPDGSYGYFRARGLAVDLQRCYPKAKVETAPVHELSRCWEGIKL